MLLGILYINHISLSLIRKLCSGLPHLAISFTCLVHPRLTTTPVHFLLDLLYTILRYHILYPVLEALVKAIGLAKIGISNFAVSRLANLALSVSCTVQPEFSGHTLTLFDFRGHFTNLIRI